MTPEIKGGDTAEFKYEVLDIETADFLRRKESNMREILSKAYTELGKELKEAQERLSNRRNGMFQSWVNSLGFSIDKAQQLIHRYVLITEKFSDKSSLLEGLPVTLTYQIASPSSETTDSKRQAKQAVLNGEVKTLKEYRELEKRLAEEQKKRSQVEQQLNAIKKPEVIVKTEYVEIEVFDRSAEERLRKYEEKFGDIENYTDRHSATNLQEVTASVISFSKTVRDLAKRHAYLIQYQHVIGSLDEYTQAEYNETIQALEDLANDFKKVEKGATVFDAEYTIY